MNILDKKLKGKWLDLFRVSGGRGKVHEVLLWSQIDQEKFKAPAKLLQPKAKKQGVRAKSLSSLLPKK